MRATLFATGYRAAGGLRANDAIHLATAKQMDVAEFHTYDGQLSRYEEVLGFPICEPRSDQPRIG